MFNVLSKIQYNALEVFGYDSYGAPAGSRNPFVKIGDIVRLHSIRGRFRVVQIEEDYFVVSYFYHKWMIRKEKELQCAWEDFRGWTRK